MHRFDIFSKRLMAVYEESPVRPRRIGLIYTPTPTLVLEFAKLNGRLYHRRMPLPRLSPVSDPAEVVQRLRNRFQDYLPQHLVSEEQLLGLVKRLREHAPRRSSQEATVGITSDTTDFNKLNNDELSKAKARMDVAFEQNQVHPGDPDFIYDLEVSFDGGAGTGKANDWDEWSEEEEVVL